MEDQFYMVLPSNSSMDIYSNNTTACFTVKLPHEIRLKGSWEVGMTEIHYPLSFLHLSEKHAIFRAQKAELNHSVIDLSEYSISHGLYKSVDNFLYQLNKDLKSSNLEFYRNERKPSYVSVKSTCKVDGKDKEDCVHVFEASRHLLKILGFDNKENSVTVNQEPITGERPVNILNAIPRQLFVYTDIIEPLIVGNVKTSLLRIVPVNLKSYTFGNHHYQTFAPVKYIPLLTNNFATITIDIRDEIGEAMPFEFGTLIVTLHFRKKNLV